MKDFFSNIGYVQWVGIVSGVLTSISMLPQVIKIFKEKKAANISLVMILVLMAGIGGWVYYGVLRKDYPIIFTNAFSFSVNLMLLVLYFKYGDKK